MVDTRTAAYGALLLRVGLGVLALSHGLLKIFVFTVPGTVGYFESIGYPGFFAYLVIAGETAGGLALITGIYARVAAVAMVPILIGATLQHAPNGWLFSSANGGWEFPAFWIVALVAQALIGPGAFAVKVPNLAFLGRGSEAKAQSV